MGIFAVYKGYLPVYFKGYGIFGIPLYKPLHLVTITGHYCQIASFVLYFIKAGAQYVDYILDKYNMSLDAKKTCLRGFANNKGADQPAHTRSLISTFVIRYLESYIH